MIPTNVLALLPVRRHRWSCGRQLLHQLEAVANAARGAGATKVAVVLQVQAVLRRGGPSPPRSSPSPSPPPASRLPGFLGSPRRSQEVLGGPRKS